MNRNIVAVILIVLAAGIYFTMTERIMGEANLVQADNVNYLKAIESAKQLLSERDKVRQDLASIEPADLERLNKMVPKSIDNIRLIIDLTNVALKHGFALQNVKATAGSAAPGAAGTPAYAPAPSAGSAANQNGISVPTIDTVSISFSIIAPYQQFIGFMQDLEANLRLMDVTHISMTASDTGIYNFNVQLRAYWLRQQ
ncbi:MAG: hypothetical protein QOG91_319 [Candidatus Parcubacteria bacterium]|jgi:Tfp pilus assembly protein PilO|nr:hypothetical protein [Candidatus Parcubacteria bacterium]